MVRVGCCGKMNPDLAGVPDLRFGQEQPEDHGTEIAPPVVASRPPEPLFGVLDVADDSVWIGHQPTPALPGREAPSG